MQRPASRPILSVLYGYAAKPLMENRMKMQWMCVVALGCASVLSATTAKAQTDQDKQFLTMASQSDFNEITFSQLALQKSTNPKVKAFAQRMITDHTRLEQEMKPFAVKWGLTPASSLGPDHQELYNQLQGLSGSEFDKQYMTDMTQDHVKAVEMFQSEVGSTQLPKFKAAVEKGEKVVEHHLEMAKKIDGEMGVPAS